MIYIINYIMHYMGFDESVKTYQCKSRAKSNFQVPGARNLKESPTSGPRGDPYRAL